MSSQPIENKGRIFVFSAPSGAGKTTILKQILERFPELVVSVSATTRKPREGEVDGLDYYFISEGEFLSKINNHDFVEWEKFYDYYYGTLKSSVEDTLDLGKSMIFEVDVKGALSIKKVFPQAYLIFIQPPDIAELKRRLEARNTESNEDLRKRVERAEMELNFKDMFDYVVVNSDLEMAVEKVNGIILKALEDK
ncbi:MAG: guanylate kinase [Melioribacteraceae bacterium]|nr:MAG: guanylate kinase [Melioribacteraceae bacterium]